MLFRKNVERYCEYCRFAAKIDNETMICRKCGIVTPEHRCRRFRYDALKRTPAPPVKQDFSQFEQTDFSL